MEEKNNLLCGNSDSLNSVIVLVHLHFGSNIWPSPAHFFRLPSDLFPPVPICSEGPCVYVCAHVQTQGSLRDGIY